MATGETASAAMNVAVTATFRTVGLLFVELNMKQTWAGSRIGQL
jgi:hypothetical protein